ncbi:MAG: sigma-70 family RNA polymerase sigma factor [Deltaproteobacteria bacterium]
MDRPLGHDADAGTLHDALAADDPSPADAAALRIESARVEAALAQLPARAQHVLRGRYWRGKTLTEVGAEIGVTRERVRQIEVAALSRNCIGCSAPRQTDAAQY